MPKNDFSVLLGELINERIGQLEEADTDGVTPFITQASESGQALQETLSPEQMKLWNKFDNCYGAVIEELTNFWYKNGFKDGLNIVNLLRESLEG